tara:strand:+ start:1 stop:1701 length:1701 start_codon:yes stop_codon:yes gene_type:complete
MAQSFPKKREKKQKPVKVFDFDRVVSELEECKPKLKAKWDELECSKVYRKELIDELDLGYSNDNKMMYAHHNAEGQVVNWKKHNALQSTTGDAKSKWYLRHKLASYSTKEPLYICEGEKDTLALYSRYLQSISSTTGCKSFPTDDLEVIAKWKVEIFICYDKDKSGKEGASKLAQSLLLINENLKIVIVKWADELKDKYDVFDSCLDDPLSQGLPKNLEDAMYNLDEYEKLYIPQQIGGVQLLMGKDAQTTEVPDVIQIVENLLPEHCNTILGGTTGSNKSYLAMQMTMSIASNQDRFLDFKINKKNQKVLFIDTEVGRDELTRRFQRILKNLPNWNNDCNKRFTMIHTKGTPDELYKSISKFVALLKPDIVVLDCLYNTTGSSDIGKGHNLKPFLNKIDDMKEQNNSTWLLVHHYNKGNHDSGLSLDRLSGSSQLGFWMEHCILITKTNDRYKRLLRIDKSRKIDFPNSYYLLEWEFPMLKNLGIPEDWKHYLLTEDKKDKWAESLDAMPKEFTTEQFRIKVVESNIASDRTAKNWLKAMEKIQIIEKIAYATWKKRLNLITEQE